MLEYVYFDFEPFGRSGRVSSLDEFLGFVESREVGDKFPFQYEIAEDMCRGLAHLHELGIVHCDIKPANVLVSNQHYCSLSNKNDLLELFEVQPIVCKQADFGESPSAVNQTAQLCRLVTSNIARGTPVYRASELFSHDSEGSKLSLAIQDLKAVDKWALGMLLFVLINPDLKQPFQIELKRVQSGRCLKELERMTSKNEKRGYSLKYHAHQASDWHRLLNLFVIYEN